MVIVFDTGPVTADRAFKRPASRALLEECKEGRIRVVVPQAVFEEVVRATSGWLESAKNNLGRARHNLEAAFKEPPSVPDIDVGALTESYRAELQRTLEEHDVLIAPWHHVSHDEIVERDLAQKPPFDKSGRGYRDTLIWHVIRDLVVDEGERVVFITKDKDYSSDEDEALLHPALVAEIEGDAAAVTIVQDLSDAMRVLGQARDGFKSELAARIEGQANDIGSRVLGLLDDELLPYGLQSDIGNGWVRDVEIGEIYEAWGVWTGSVYADLEFEYTGILNEAEFEAYFESEGNARLFTNEMDWSEEQRYALVDGSGVVSVAFAVTYDPSDTTLDVTDAVLTIDPKDLPDAESEG